MNHKKFDIEAMLELRRQGLSQTAIAKRFGCNRATVQRYLALHPEVQPEPIGPQQPEAKPDWAQIRAKVFASKNPAEEILWNMSKESWCEHAEKPEELLLLVPFLSEAEYFSQCKMHGWDTEYNPWKPATAAATAKPELRKESYEQAVAVLAKGPAKPVAIPKAKPTLEQPPKDDLFKQCCEALHRLNTAAGGTLSGPEAPARKSVVPQPPVLNVPKPGEVAHFSCCCDECRMRFKAGYLVCDGEWVFAGTPQKTAPPSANIDPRVGDRDWAPHAE